MPTPRLLPGPYQSRSGHCVDSCTADSHNEQMLTPTSHLGSCTLFSDYASLLPVLHFSTVYSFNTSPLVALPVQATCIKHCVHMFVLRCSDVGKTGSDVRTLFFFQGRVLVHQSSTWLLLPAVFLVPLTYFSLSGH